MPGDSPAVIWVDRFLADGPRLHLPRGLTPPKGLGLVAVGKAWAEWTTDPEFILPGGEARFGSRAGAWDGRFDPARRALKGDFRPDPGTELLVVTRQWVDRTDIWAFPAVQLPAFCRHGASAPEKVRKWPEYVSPWLFLPPGGA